MVSLCTQGSLKLLCIAAQAAPAAFAPHLQSLVADIQRLYDAGALREGEKVLLWEGECGSGLKDLLSGTVGKWSSLNKSQKQGADI